VPIRRANVRDGKEYRREEMEGKRNGRTVARELI
jgi:hypothetical protein